VTAGTDIKILERLREQEEREGSLSRLLDFYRRLLDIQSGAGQLIGVPGFSPNGEAVAERIRQGVPLLQFDDLAIDWSLLQTVFEDVAGLLAGYPEVSGVPELGDDSNYDADFLKEAARAWFEGGSPVSGLVDADGAALEFVVGAAFSPFLKKYREVLLGAVSQEQWRRGYCPICRGIPDFAFLDRERGVRWLLCSRCDAEWIFQRLECPYCGNKDQDALAYFTDDRGLYRLYVCERCRCYLKAIDLRRADYEVLLPLERFLTVDIDVQAHRDGYHPCTGSEAGRATC
jgi:FdhE protein